MDPCFVGCFYYTDSCFRADCAHRGERPMTMTGFSRLAMDSRASQGARVQRELSEKEPKMTKHYPHAIPAHKQTDPAKAPGQVVNPIPPGTPGLFLHGETPAPSKLYKPTHGGYPG